MKIHKDILTGKDNETYDSGRLSLFIGVISFVVFSGFAVFKAGTFDYISYGSGFAAICAGAGALLKLKEGSEP